MTRNEEFFDIMQELSIFHNVFLSLWKMGKPTFTESVPTAAVSFDADGACLSFAFNPTFWDSIDSYTKAFVICHECLHVILNHGYRMSRLNPELSNVALDLAVNHMLVNNFDFDRDKINDWEKYCWVETIFKKKSIPNDKNFEFYYDLLYKDAKKIPKYILVDFHGSLPKGHEIKDLIRDCADGVGEVGEKLETGTTEYLFQQKQQKVSLFWDRILKNIASNVKIKETKQFVSRNRRMVFLNPKFMIPNEYEQVTFSKPEIYLFLDCSGSCHSIHDTFFDLAKTINPKKYKVKLFSRTTQVKEIIKKSKNEYVAPYVGGSDDFRCIENFIQEEISTGKIKEYPIVIHFTDGGDCSGVMVQPKYPERWYWLLKGHNKRWIPKECKNVYDISDIV